jgi:hypothetical protein
MGLFKLFKKKSISKEAILNEGMQIAMEFGENWLQPIGQRLKSEFDHISDSEAIEYDNLCRNARDEAHNFMLEALGKLADEHRTIMNQEFKLQFDSYINNYFDWMNKANIKKLYSQGMYYAYKEGLDATVIN